MNESNKIYNSLNNDLDYNADDIRYELSQILSVMELVERAASDIFPMNDKMQTVSNSLYLLLRTMRKTVNRYEVLIGFSDPE